MSDFDGLDPWHRYMAQVSSDIQEAKEAVSTDEIPQARVKRARRRAVRLGLLIEDGVEGGAADAG